MSTKRGIARLHGADRPKNSAFDYFASDGSVIADAAEIERIEHLAIPPAWTDVWISERPWARLQATGRDHRGRKQYRYHEHFRNAREASKFAALVEYGRALPAIRRQWITICVGTGCRERRSWRRRWRFSRPPEFGSGIESTPRRTTRTA